MDVLVGTRQCPHLGFSANNGLPCCRADDQVREACGKGIQNPKAAENTFGEEPFYCAVLGADALPPEALKFAAKLRAQKKQAEHQARGSQNSYRAPSDVTGKTEVTSREQDEDTEQPVIPTHTLRAETSPPRPNAPCPCGSGKKYKKCCGK